MRLKNARRWLVSVLAGLSISATPASADYALETYAVSDVLSNVDGGIETGTAVLADIGLVFQSDFEAILGDGDATFSAYVIWNNASRFSDRYVGDLQSVSSIDAPEAIRLYEFWYEQQLTRASSMRFGLYDLNSEFDYSETSSLFVNGSHGIGAEYGQTGQAGPSIFPYTSLALRFEVAIREWHTLRYAVLDATPGDPDDPNRSAIHLSGDDGVLHALEYNYGAPGEAQFGLGAWAYSADFELVEPTADEDRADGNKGIYGFADLPVASWDNGTHLDVFLRYGVADDRFNTLREYMGAGAVLTGLAPSRPDDQLGLAIASGHIGSPWRRAGGDFVEGHETAIELTYSAQLTDWLRVQPDIQYIINPGADRSLENALVIGIRFELGKRFASE
jgi:porin